MSAESDGEVVSRRAFLLGCGAVAAGSAALLGCTKKTFSGGIEGSDYRLGHRLLDVRDMKPQKIEKTGIVIVGAGIAGLSAARELTKQGFKDFVLLELEDRAGGNSMSGQNGVSPYPWAAHYVPLPGEDSVFVKGLFEELGIIKGYDPIGLPIYDEYCLCFDPQERLFIHGRWQEGLLPQIGISQKDGRQYEEFFGLMQEFKETRGRDGRRAFSIPVDFSSHDPLFTRFDSISMADFMAQKGWNSKYLLWYVNYCCRDDYGCTMKDVSAWAGIHYFAARNGVASNAPTHAVITWPEGNGKIVERLSEPLNESIRKRNCVLDIKHSNGRVTVDCFDASLERVVRFIADRVVYAAPRYTALRSIEELRKRRPEYAGSFSYAPWMTANVTVKGLPEGEGAHPAWDNVAYSGSSLGYISAVHQVLSSRPKKGVLTYYHPLTSLKPAEERQKALETPFRGWAEMTLRELEGMHPGIEREIEEIRVRVWGHAMVRPEPGFIWGKARRAALKPSGQVFFGNSDMSGLSLFEEAQYRGIKAAKAALGSLSGLKEELS